MDVPQTIIDRITGQLADIGAKPFFLCVSGSDAYGFSSENNSDVDVRGSFYFTNLTNMFIPPINRKLTITGEMKIDGLPYEWHLHEVMKFFEMVSNSNINVIDWIYSPTWVFDVPEFIGWSQMYLKEFARSQFSIKMVHCAIGWSKNMVVGNWGNPKKVLHSLRPLMSVLLYLKTDRYIIDINALVLNFQMMYCRMGCQGDSDLIDHDDFQMYHEIGGLVDELIELKCNGYKVPLQLKNMCIDLHESLVKSVKLRQHRLRQKDFDELTWRDVVADIRIKTIEHQHIN